jgi:hypothetical protein
VFSGVIASVLPAPVPAPEQHLAVRLHSGAAADTAGTFDAIYHVAKAKGIEVEY